MSAEIREKAQRLRRKYARNFNVDIADVLVREFVNNKGQDDAEVFAPGQGLPAWTVGA